MPYSLIPEIIVEEVRKELRKKLGKEIPKAGILIYPFSPEILAYTRVGSFIIYLNSIPYTNTLIDKTQYLFVVILHEYLHLLGIADEREVRRITLDIIQDRFGESSKAYKFAMSLADPRDIYLRSSWKKGKPMPYI